MLTVLLVLQVIIAIALVFVVLIQRNASDGLAGLGGGSTDSVLSGRASANILTKITSFLATAFMINCLVMATITARNNEANSLDETLGIEKQSEESKPSEPSVPITD